MNELQIIQQQLATERQHFTQIAQMCCAVFDKAIANNGGQSIDEPLQSACRDYFAWVAQSLDSDARGLMDEKLLALRDASGPIMGHSWRELIELLRREVDRRHTALTAESARTPRIDEWRSAVRIDADSILAERAAYARVKAALAPALPAEFDSRGRC